MRTLLIPLYYNLHQEDPNLFDGMIEAFEQFGDVRMYSGVVSEAISFMPDLIVFQGSVSVEDLAEIKEKTCAAIAMYTGDCRLAPIQSLYDFRSVVDIYLLPFQGELSTSYSRMLGKPCRFIWEAIQNWRFLDFKERQAGPIVFVGNAYETTHADRIGMSDYLTKHCPEFECYGSISNSQGEISILRTPDLYQSAYCVIAENNYNVDSYFTQRNIGAMAAGSCVLMKWFPNISNWFTNWEDCVIYNHNAELLHCIEFLRRNPEVRNEIAKTGRERVNIFTYKHWAIEFIKQVTLKK